LKLVLFQFIEQEHFDIFAHTVWVKWIPIGSETHGDVAFTRGIGTQLNHARIWMRLIVNTEIKGFHDWRKEGMGS
jgi:hypothetical protein